MTLLQHFSFLRHLNERKKKMKEKKRPLGENASFDSMKGTCNTIFCFRQVNLIPGLPASSKKFFGVVGGGGGKSQSFYTLGMRSEGRGNIKPANLPWEGCGNFVHQHNFHNLWLLSTVYLLLLVN